MSIKNCIKFSTIKKRSQCLNSHSQISESATSSDKLYDHLNTIFERSKTGRELSLQTSLRSFMESLYNTDSASDNYWQVLEISSKINDIDSNISDNIIFEFSTKILPYIENLSMIPECLNNYELTDNQRNTIIENVSLYNTADRIIKNDDMLSKRFNTSNMISKYKFGGLKYFIDSCASMIDTYRVSNYQKFNITLEECNYLLEKNNIKENKEDIVKYSLEYFLITNPTVLSRDIDNYRRTINESYVLEESDLGKIKFLFTDSPIEIDSVESGIQNILLSDNKTDKNISSTIDEIISKSTKEDIIYNSDKLISVIWDLVKNEVLESDEELYNSVNNLARYISEVSIETEEGFTKDNITSIINSMEDISDTIKLSGNSDLSIGKISNKFIKEAVDPCITLLKETNDLLYNKDNLDAIDYVNGSGEEIPLNEFKLFKFHNLVRAAFNLDKFLKVKERKFYNKSKAKINGLTRKAKHILFGESVNMPDLGHYMDHISDYIGNDHKTDICVSIYQYNENELDSITDFLEASCSEYNDILLSQNETCRCYYIINPGIAEVRIKEKASIKEEDIIDISESLDPVMFEYINMLAEAESVLSNIDNVKFDSIEDIICNISSCEDFNLDKFKLGLEAMSIFGVSEEAVSLFESKFNNYHFNNAIENGIINESYIKLAGQEREVSELVSNFSVMENVAWEDRLEAYAYFSQLLEAYSYPDPDDDDDEDEDDEEEKKEPEKSSKKPSEIYKDELKEIEDIKKDDNNAPKGGYKSSGFNLNSIKLGIEGIKAKYKEMSNKHKEIARNLDNSVRYMIKGMKDASTSNRREAIIKGSVIPSFSRCIKAGIALCAVGYFSLPLACIGAIGGFALSKKLTDKERLLLLDEIETELEVVDKELAIADSNNEINKYRELLKYKKELQRQYQRIKYNIRIGKDILPSSNAGLPEN